MRRRGRHRRAAWAPALAAALLTVAVLAVLRLLAPGT